MNGKQRFFLIAVLYLLLFQLALGDEHNHEYKEKDEVVLWMNTIGPYSNRQETYTYYSLPFCRGEKNTLEHYHETLSEALLGVELEHSGLDIRFKGIFLSFFFYKISFK